jgi:hypothetical protein
MIVGIDSERESVSVQYRRHKWLLYGISQVLFIVFISFPLSKERARMLISCKWDWDRVFSLTFLKRAIRPAVFYS